MDAERAGAVYRSQHDHISGLPNRTVLTARMADALDDENRLVSVLLIDLNHFKDVNTTLGHLEGDQILAQVGARLRAAVREEDVVAHLGGDEFVVLLTDVTADDEGLEVAARLHAVLDESFAVGDVEIDVEATMALAVSGQPGGDPDTLLRNAYVAMETAKAQGHPVLVHEQAADEKSSHKLVLLSDLRRGISRRELVLHYQPKIDIGSGALVGAEALVRWNHPELGFVPPDRFIPIAEQTGLIHPLTHYVLDAALVQARTWQQAGTPVRVAVNLSARNLLNDELPGQIAELLTANGVSAALLELEVTESAIMTDPQRARRVLNELAGMGIGLSIDDFGTGYTSIGQLRHLPVHELKIDRSFVTALATDATDAMIVRSIVELGHNLGLSIVAEGVEDDATRCVLAGVGCDIAQGFGISRPLPAGRFDEWMAAYEARPAVSLSVQ
nr:bifunctional diguanylate cyclase/phosphodiesterase [Kineosporia mesophila]